MVRSGQPIISRPEWFDRNPVHRYNYYFGLSQSPHSDTNRFTYTVPAGKKAFIELLTVFLIRDGAPTTAGWSRATLYLQPSGGTLQRCLIASIYSASLGASDHAELGQNCLLYPGDVVTGETGDGSTGGSVTYVVAAKITEFDA